MLFGSEGGLLGLKIFSNGGRTKTKIVRRVRAGDLRTGESLPEIREDRNQKELEGYSASKGADMISDTMVDPGPVLFPSPNHERVGN